MIYISYCQKQSELASTIIWYAEGKAEGRIEGRIKSKGWTLDEALDVLKFFPRTAPSFLLGYKNS